MMTEQVRRTAVGNDREALQTERLDRLESFHGCPPPCAPQAPRARALLDTLSPNGREWLELVTKARHDLRDQPTAQGVSAKQ